MRVRVALVIGVLGLVLVALLVEFRRVLRIAVRCNGAGSERNLFGTHVFSIMCPRDASTLEYQVTAGGPWTAVSIPDRPDLALVEIAVGQI